uniref:Uncharacterized protein n=1 Tax=Glossina pallidipes TaxID=7398 RepID=A0A1A9ZVQ8_GLOPL
MFVSKTRFCIKNGNISKTKQNRDHSIKIIIDFGNAVRVRVVYKDTSGLYDYLEINYRIVLPCATTWLRSIVPQYNCMSTKAPELSINKWKFARFFKHIIDSLTRIDVTIISHEGFKASNDGLQKSVPHHFMLQLISNEIVPNFDILTNNSASQHSIHTSHI